MASGMSAADALREASRGGLVGMGCEAHEAKAVARKERLAEKRKSRSEWKQVAKMRKLEGKREARVEEIVNEEDGSLHLGDLPVLASSAITT